MAKHIRRRRLAIAAALLVGGQAALAAPTAAIEPGTFTVDVDGLTVGAAPEAFVGDADASITVRLTNTSSSQVLGAADVAVPAPFALVAAADDAVAGGPVIELRDLGLAPGASRDVTATVDVHTCTAGPTGPFGAHATSGGDLTGAVLTRVEPSDLQVDVVGSCVLAFASQPTDATRGATITSVPFEPAGAPIAVEVTDGSGTARATSSDAVVGLTAVNAVVPAPVLGGTTVTTAVAGLATFAPGPVIEESAYGYTLVASSPSMAEPATSGAFAVVDDQVSCPAGEPCAGSATSSEGGYSVSASFGAGPTAATLVVSLGAADAPDFSCARYPRPADAVVSQFEFLGGSGAGRIGTMTTVIPSATRPISAYEACWAAPYPFTTDGGLPSTVQGTKPGTGEPLHVGIVPNCKPRRWTLPCVKSRTFDRRTRSVTVTVLATGDDPLAVLTGAPEGPIGGARSPRRAVTLVFADIRGSTELAERLDAESLRTLLTLYFDEIGAVVEERGGVVAKIVGDAVVAVFDAAADPAGAARQAARAVLDCRAALAPLNDRFHDMWGVRIEVRTGIASGSLSASEIAEAGTDAEVLAGDVIGAAESLESAAPVGQALVDAPTVALLGDAADLDAVGPVPRKGGVGTVDAWRLVEVAASGGTGSERAVATVPCPSCGAANDPHHWRCATCDALLGSAASAVGSRRTVTVLFADPMPVVAAGDRPDPDATRAAMSRYIDVMRPILERHGGTVEKFIGDALMAVFGLPVRHEDDAARAVRAASEMQAARDDLNDEVGPTLGVRFANPIGVNTGSVVAGDSSAGQRFVTGDAVNVAARLEQTAAPGDVVLGELTRRLAGAAVEVEVLEPLVLKGKTDRVPAFRLVRMVDRSAGRAATARRDLPLVGRDVELDALRNALGDAVRDGRAGRVTLIGDAGVGKSRLTEAFLADAGRSALLLRGSCLTYGEGITFWPLVRVVQAAAGIEEGDDASVALVRLADLIDDEPAVLDRVASLAGLVDTPFAVPELVWALRRLFERLAASTPLVVVLDDVHWAEPTLLEVVEQLSASVRAPVLFLCTARPTVLEHQADFVDAAPSVSLRPLDDSQCERLLRLLLGDSVVDAAVVGRIVEVAAGNPLFVEQLLSMLVDDGRLRLEDGRWTLAGHLATLEVPASIEAVLTARLDRLAPSARDTIEPASVIGRHFPVEAVRHLVAADLRPLVVDELREIAERGLVVPVDDEEPGYRFQHQLIRDATYNGLLKQTRAVLHEDFVDWAEAANAARGRTAEVDEILGYHLEQAHGCWRELGMLDDHAVALGVRGSLRLSGAGERALARGDMSAAANLLTRSADLLPDGHHDKRRALLLAGNALHETGSFDQAIAAYERSAAMAHDDGAVAAATAAHIEGLRLRYLIGRVSDADLVAREVAAALEQVGPSGDPDAASRIWQLQLNVDIAACRWEAAQRAADLVIDHARRAGNDLLAVRTMPLLAFLAQKGPMPVPDAVDVCTSILEQVAHDRRSTSLTQLELALLSAMALDVERARHLCADTRRALVELGWEMQAALVSLGSGPIELLADDPVRAEAELRQDYEALQRMEERNFISLTGVLLAEAVYRQGRIDEAQELVELARELAAPDDLAVQILVRSLSGKVAARRGDPAAGLLLVDEAVRLMATTDDPSGLGDALLDQAEVRHLAGDATGAAAAAASARARYLDKGNLAGAGRAERCAGRLADGLDPLPGGGHAS